VGLKKEGFLGRKRVLIGKKRSEGVGTHDSKGV